MLLGSGGSMIPLQQLFQGRTMLGDQENLIFTVDWLVIYSFSMQNLVLSEECLCKFKLVKQIQFVIF